MSEQREPERLLEAHAALDGPLRRALGTARTEAPSAADLERMTAGVIHSLSVGPPETAVSATHASALKSGWLKLIALAGLGGALFVLSAHPHGPQSAQTTSSALPSDTAAGPTAEVQSRSVRAAAMPSAVPAQVPAQVAALADTLEGPVARLDSPEPVPLRPTGPTTHATDAPAAALSPRSPTEAERRADVAIAPTRRQRAARVVAAPADRRRPRLVIEDAPPEDSADIGLLTAAQGALLKRPGEALALLSAHRRAFPGSSFAEERDALTLEALHRMGNTSELRAQAQAFLQRYAASPHRDAIERLLRAP